MAGAGACAKPGVRVRPIVQKRGDELQRTHRRAGSRGTRPRRQRGESGSSSRHYRGLRPSVLSILRSHTVHLCDARPASGAGCALSLCVRVRRPSLPGDDCSIYLFICLVCPFYLLVWDLRRYPSLFGQWETQDLHAKGATPHLHFGFARGAVIFCLW